MNGLEIFATALCGASILCYAAAGAFFLRQKEKIAYLLSALGWLCNLGIFVKNWYLNGYPPFASMYQVLSDISLLFVVLMVLIVKFKPEQKWVAPYFCFGAIVPLMGTLFMDRNMRWSLMPALRSPYFVPHVFSYVLSYALCAVAFLLCVIGLFRKRKREQYEDAAYLILRIAFPFMTLGLLLGALWADQVWGNYWTWDIKEVWSLITAAFYLCYFHARRVPKMKKYATVFSLIAFGALVFTFLCVNVLPNVGGSMHTYT